MTRQFRERREKKLRAMQQEVDGRGQVQAASVARPLAKTQNSNAPPSIAPARVKAPPRASNDGPPLWFAIWSVNRNLACALKTNPDEIKLCEQSVRSAKRAWGDEFSGPFTSQHEAQRVAAEKLAEESRRQRRA
jgi:hypothetical protein